MDTAVGVRGSVEVSVDFSRFFNGDE